MASITANADGTGVAGKVVLGGIEEVAGGVTARAGMGVIATGVLTTPAGGIGVPLVAGGLVMVGAGGLAAYQGSQIMQQGLEDMSSPPPAPMPAPDAGSSFVPPPVVVPPGGSLAGASVNTGNLAQMTGLDGGSGIDTSNPGFTPAPVLPPLPGFTPTSDAVKATLGAPETLPADTTAGGMTVVSTPAAPPLSNVVSGSTSGDGLQGSQIVESQRDPSLTQPTGPIDGVPSGSPSTTAAGAPSSNKAQVDSENQVAGKLAAAGYQTVQNPTVGDNPSLTPERMAAEGLNPNKDPDLLVEGRIYDTYTPVVDDASSIQRGIEEKIVDKQTQRVVVDLRGTTQTAASVRAALQAQPIPGLKEVIIVTDNGVGQPFRP